MFISYKILIRLVYLLFILVFLGVHIMKKAILYVHGKGGTHTEAENYKKNCLGFDIIGIDYKYDVPWLVQQPLKHAYDTAYKQYDKIFILANSIGAYFVMNTLQNCKIEKALFISPVLDMEQLILDMMNWANISEKKLREKSEIPTDFGETLSWKYLCYVREHPINWTIPTEILYGENDNLITKKTINIFVDHHNAHLTVMKDGEHWFHTDKQLFFLDNWMKQALK